MRVVWLTGCAWLVSLALTAAQETNPVVEVARLPSYTESPAINHDGNVFVSEPFGKNVSRISPEGDVTVWASTGNPNGHKVLADGGHLVCDREQHAVLHLRFWHTSDGNLEDVLHLRENLEGHIDSSLPRRLSNPSGIVQQPSSPRTWMYISGIPEKPP